MMNLTKTRWRSIWPISFSRCSSRRAMMTMAKRTLETMEMMMIMKRRSSRDLGRNRSRSRINSSTNSRTKERMKEREKVREMTMITCSLIWTS